MNNEDIGKLPFVEFEYPDSQTNKMKEREVYVTKMNDTYVCGYEIDYRLNNTAKVPVFKRYRIDRIATNGIHLLYFNND